MVFVVKLARLDTSTTVVYAKYVMVLVVNVMELTSIIVKDVMKVSY